MLYHESYTSSPAILISFTIPRHPFQLDTFIHLLKACEILQKTTIKTFSTRPHSQLHHAASNWCGCGGSWGRCWRCDCFRTVCLSGDDFILELVVDFFTILCVAKNSAGMSYWLDLVHVFGCPLSAILTVLQCPYTVAHHCAVKDLSKYHLYMATV